MPRRPPAPRPHKRVTLRRRFEVDGADCVLLVYTDGTARVRVDHPSDDPLVEGFIAGQLIERANAMLRAEGFEYAVGPTSWRSDPDGTPANWHRRR